MTHPARRRERDDDEGFALLTVLLSMLILLSILLTTTAVVANTLKSSRRVQDYQASLQAAQAGIDDYRSRLNNCDAYWTKTATYDPCPGSPAEVASGTWATVPGATGTAPAQYKYSVLSTPTTTGGIIRLEAWGRVKGVTRSVIVDFRKASFLDYIYYTDFESSDPDLLTALRPSRTEFYGGTANVGGTIPVTVTTEGVTSASDCAHHWYDESSSGRSTLGANPYEKNVTSVTPTKSTNFGNVGVGCDINFAGGDSVNGPLYTNDAMLLCSNASGDPVFKGVAQTFWQTTANPANSATAPYRANSGCTNPSQPSTSGNAIVVAKKAITLPPTNTSIRSAAVSGGCLFTGPTRITLNDSSYQVQSPLTTSAGSGCTGFSAGSGTSSSVRSGNGVVYVDPAPGATCTGLPQEVLGTYPVAGDVTKYDCKAGTAFVQGRLSGKLTIATANDVIVTGNTTYKDGVSGTDILGLAAQGYVSIYHPVACRLSVPAGDVCPDILAAYSTSSTSGTQWKNSGGYYTNINSPSNLEVDAAILSVSHSFIVQNSYRASSVGSLKVVGGIYQRFRGAVASSGLGGTGYTKNYVYDPRLKTLSPPSFLDPLAAPWLPDSFAEVKP